MKFLKVCFPGGLGTHWAGAEYDARYMTYDRIYDNLRHCIQHMPRAGTRGRRCRRGDFEPALGCDSLLDFAIGCIRHPGSTLLWPRPLQPWPPWAVLPWPLQLWPPLVWNIYIYIYTHIYICIRVYIYIYIYTLKLTAAYRSHSPRLPGCSRQEAAMRWYIYLYTYYIYREILHICMYIYIYTHMCIPTWGGHVNKLDIDIDKDNRILSNNANDSVCVCMCVFVYMCAYTYIYIYI